MSKKEKLDMSIMKDKRGAHRTESLFVEVISPQSAETYTPVYSLRDYDNKGYPSMYNIFMAATDEHEAALKLVGSLAHWRKLCKLKWFMEGRELAQFEGLRVWREDMLARDASTAKATLIEETEEGNVTAAKALYSLENENKKKLKGKLVVRDQTPSEKDVSSAVDNIVRLTRK